MSYSNKVAVITGASRGLGAGLADAFSHAGMRLGLCARTVPAALKNNPAVIAHSVDVTDTRNVFEFAEQVEQSFGAIDLWINNAGVLDPVKPLRDIAIADFRSVLETNIIGVVNGAQAFIAHRQRYNNPGVLINISSGAGQSGYAGWSAYCASKAAVDRLSEALSLEEAEQNLRVYSVAPGVVDTDMQHSIRNTSADDFPMVERFRELKKNNHFNTPQFVAQQLLTMAFDHKSQPTSVVVRLANEWEDAEWEDAEWEDAEWEDA